MSLISTVTSSGNAYVDGVLAGVQWNKATVPTLTYSFPTVATAYESGYMYGEPSSGFAAISEQQTVAIRDILGGASGYTSMFGYGSYSSVIDYAFQLVASPTDGTVDTAVLRTAQSSLPSTAWGYYPEDYPEAGDIWYGTGYAGTQYDYRLPTPGTYMWHTAVHELGHAMGLKHGQENAVPDGGFAPVPADRNAMEFTIMTYATYLGDTTPGASNETYGFAQTLMMLDIAALQYMYGANFTTYAGQTRYRWDPLTGEMSISENGGAFVGQGRPGGPNAPANANRVFLTIWDGNGNDTYDMSNYTNAVSIDLRPGQWSVTSPTQLANLNGYYIDNPIYAQGNVYNALLFNGDTRSLIENAIGGSGNDTIVGNDAANLLDGGSGADALTGGAGNDTYVVDDAGDVVTEAQDEGIDTVRSTRNYTLGAYLENLALLGTTATLGTGNELDNQITGNSASNALEGGLGNDTLDGGAGLDTLIGGIGDDWLNGGTGADSLVGGSGNDTFVVNSILDKTVEASDEGIDTVQSTVTHTLGANVENLILIGSANINGTGNTLDNTLMGNSAVNLLRGGAGNDTLDGADGNDILSGEAGNDSLSGGEGNDQLDGGLDHDTLGGGNGTDKLIGGEGDDALLGDAGNDTLTGGNGNDTLDGGADADRLDGGAGNDSLLGGEGSDTLIGGLGLDTLDGGADSDLIVFNTLPGAGNVDTIASFSMAEDTIQLLRYWSFSALPATGTLAADAFWTGTGAHDASDRIIFDDTSGALWYDADGTGATAAVQFAELLLVGLDGTLTYENFLVV